MKTVLLVAPHFVPSFLPSVHRSRLWSYYLPEFGWKPIILTTHERYYECQTDPELFNVLPADLEVIRTRALPTKPLRLIGDISVRSFPFYYRAISKLARQRRIDFIHFTVPAYNAALLGRLIFRRYRIPYGIDYIDPWIHETPAGDPIFSKAWLTQQWAKVAEPWAVRNAQLITGINSAYFESVIRRNPHLQTRVVTAGMPYGWSERDYQDVTAKPKRLTLFDRQDGNIHLIYAGALLPKAFNVLDRLFAAVVTLRQNHPELAGRLRLHFVGTGWFENNPTRGHSVTPYAARHGLGDIVTEMPARIPYIDVLNHLAYASAVLVIGSTEPHYSPSKIYQAVLSRRPVFALLHKQSSVIESFRATNAGVIFDFDEDNLPDPMRLSVELGNFIKGMNEGRYRADLSVLEDVSAKKSARTLASALNRAICESQNR